MSVASSSREALVPRAGVGARRLLMLVSERADGGLRAAAAAGARPRPEYLHLEAAHGITILDWSQFGPSGMRRSPAATVRHVQAALASLDGMQAVFSDGEHVGIPLGLAIAARRRRLPHLVLGHHLTSRVKRPLLPLLRSDRVASRVLVHSPRQLELLRRVLPERKLAVVPYGIDDRFWRPPAGVEEEEDFILAAGREHRDYATLAAAVRGLGVRVRIAAGSLHSPRARQRDPLELPAGSEIRFAPHSELRALYARAALVVVPLVPNDFQAGITTILEAMAMGKAVVVSATRGQRDVVRDGHNGLLVPPGDPEALRAAILDLLGDRRRRALLGKAGRHEVEERFGLETYARSLAGHLEALAGGQR